MNWTLHELSNINSTLSEVECFQNRRIVIILFETPSPTRQRNFYTGMSWWKRMALCLQTSSFVRIVIKVFAKDYTHFRTKLKHLTRKKMKCQLLFFRSTSNFIQNFVKYSLGMHRVQCCIRIAHTSLLCERTFLLQL